MGACSPCTCCFRDSNSKEDRNELEELLHSNDRLSIRIFTWNVCAQQPNNTSLNKLLRQTPNESDIVVIGLQEIIDINSAKSMLFDDNSDAKWDNIILRALNSHIESKKSKFKKSKHNKQLITYSQLRSIRLMGILLLIYIKDTMRTDIDIHSLMSNRIGAGLFGIGPNKGAVAIRFSIYNTSICFICSHLAAHKPNVQERNDNYHKIMTKLTFQRESLNNNDIDSKDNNISIKSHDLVFFFGDLNYRLDYDEMDTVYRLIRKHEWSKLLVKEQLLTQMKEKKAFAGFKEHAIAFKPTYKFEIGGCEYDKIKGRMPGYCDRILWKMNAEEYIEENENNNVKCACRKYDSFDDECLSDHKPVVGLFEVKCQIYF